MCVPSVFHGVNMRESESMAWLFIVHTFHSFLLGKFSADDTDTNPKHFQVYKEETVLFILSLVCTIANFSIRLAMKHSLPISAAIIRLLACLPFTPQTHMTRAIHSTWESLGEKGNPAACLEGHRS